VKAAETIIVLLFHLLFTSSPALFQVKPTDALKVLPTMRTSVLKRDITLLQAC